MRTIERARRTGTPIRTCGHAHRHPTHTHERKCLGADGSWTLYTALCPGKH